MKAWLVSLGHPLYSQLWNDQPPLHTELVALLFRVFGPSACLARMLNVGFASLLVAAIYGLVRQQSGRLAGLMSILFLASSFLFLRLSVAVMLELPAMSLALAAVWAWSRYSDTGKSRWLAWSGAIFGCALQVKLTAAIFLPAFIIDFLWSRARRHRETGRPVTFGRRPGWREAALWPASAFGIFALLFLAFYRWDTLTVFWRAHFSAGTGHAALGPSYAFDPAFLLNNPGLLIPAATGFVLAICQRRRDLLFPIALLATAFAIHLWHHPYWDYYALHFGIPMAWLAAAGVVDLFRWLWNWRQRPCSSFLGKLGVGTLVVSWSLIISLVLIRQPELIGYEVQILKAVQTANDDETVRQFKQHAPQTHWIFTDQLACAFWAGLPIPPELAVIPKKRLWSGQITHADVIECLERYRPELIYLQPERIAAFNLSQYLEEHYRSNTANSEPPLYIRK